MFEVEYYKI